MWIMPVAMAILHGAPKINAYYAFVSYVRCEGHLYEVFLVLAKTRAIYEQVLRLF